MPVLVHDGTVIFESAAIQAYLGETFGVDKGLYPAPGRKRGEALKWLVWANVSLVEAVVRWQRNTSDRSPAELRHAPAGAAEDSEVSRGQHWVGFAVTFAVFIAHVYFAADARKTVAVSMAVCVFLIGATYPRRGWTGEVTPPPGPRRVPR